MDRLYHNAVASHEADDLNLAAEGYSAALELAPNHLPALNNLAATRAALGDTDTAVALYLDAIARHPIHVPGEYGPNPDLQLLRFLQPTNGQTPR